MLFSVKNKRVKSNTTTADTPGSDSEASAASVEQTGSKSRTDQGAKKPVVAAQTTDIVSEDDGGWQTCTKKKADKEKKEKKESPTPVVSAVSTAQSTPRCLPGTFSTNARPDLERTKLCRRFATNQQCMFAENCWFSHDIRLLGEQEHLEKEALECKEPPSHPGGKDEKKEESIVRQKPPDGPTPASKQSTVAGKSAERPDPPARQLAPTVWGTLAPVSLPHRSKTATGSKAVVPPITKALAPPTAPSIVQATPSTIAAPALKEDTLDPNWVEKPSPGLQFLQRERAEVSFLQRWGLPVEQGVEILAFTSDKQKEMVYNHFNPSADERTIDALRRFLDTCTIDDSEPEKMTYSAYQVPPPQCPPPPPGPPVVRTSEPESAAFYLTSPPLEPAHAADDQGWEDLFLMPFSTFPSKALLPPRPHHVAPFSTFPSKALVPPRPHHIAPEARKVELYQERVVTRAYDGGEVSETGLSEGGYLPLDVGDIVIPTDGDYPGHSRNRFASYFFGSLVNDGSTGWFPEAVLH